MKLLTWNVNGIRAVDKKGLFAPMVAKFKPDVICLQETKAQPHESPIDLPDYDEYWNSATKKGYSGVAIFTKHKPIAVINGLPADLVKKYKLADDHHGDPNDEGRVIVVELEKFFVVNVYTPNSKRELSRLALREKQWDPAFLEYCKKLEKKKPLVICGDFNAAHTADDLARPKDNVNNAGFTQQERDGISKFMDHFVDAFRMFTTGNGHYTWWSHFAKARERNIGWRIDYWFVSEKLKKDVKSCTIHAEILGSDHCPVLLELK